MSRQVVKSKSEPTNKSHKANLSGSWCFPKVQCLHAHVLFWEKLGVLDWSISHFQSAPVIGWVGLVEHLWFSISPVRKDLKTKLCEHITSPGLFLLTNTKLTQLDSCSAKAVVTRPLDTQWVTSWIKLPLNSSSLRGGRKLPIFVHAKKSFLLFQQHFVGRVESSQENLTRPRNIKKLFSAHLKWKLSSNVSCVLDHRDTTCTRPFLSKCSPPTWLPRWAPCCIS